MVEEQDTKNGQGGAQSQLDPQQRQGQAFTVLVLPGEAQTVSSAY